MLIPRGLPAFESGPAQQVTLPASKQWRHRPASSDQIPDTFYRDYRLSSQELEPRILPRNQGRVGSPAAGMRSARAPSSRQLG